MVYVLDAYKTVEEWEAHTIWESNRCFDGTPEICDKLLCYMRPGAKKYKIPEGVTTLSFLSFVDEEADVFDCDATTLDLPASLTKIEDSAFLFASFSSIRVAAGNTSFVVKNGGLYTADGKRLVYILTNPKREVFHIAEGTEQIDAGVLFWDGDIVFPNSVKKIADERIYDSPHLQIHMRSQLPSFRKLIVHKGSYAERFVKRMEYECEIVAK